MSAPLQQLADRWTAVRSADAYASVERFVETADSPLWPYAVIAVEIESGWSSDIRGALALNLIRDYVASEHELAAFITLSGRWPLDDATEALNLLALAHRANAVDKSPLSMFLSRAAL